MSRLKAALQREYEDDPNTTIYFHNPRNTHCVELYFRGEKTAKVMGSLAVEEPKAGNTLSGVLVKRNFNYHLLAANDLPKYTDMSMSQIMQRQSIHYSGNMGVLRHFITQVAGLLEPIAGDKKVRAFKAIDITIENKIITLEWIANPVNDMYADAIVAAILQADLLDTPIKHLSTSVKVDRMHFKECLIEMLQDMFGEDSVPKMFKGERLYVTVNDKKADIDLSNLEVTCPEDETFKQIVETAVTKLYQSLAPPQI
ncbi:cleavage and polyadenylation specificity factor 73-like [Zophobas morio]